jgi:hypothetical protein
MRTSAPDKNRNNNMRRGTLEKSKQKRYEVIRAKTVKNYVRTDAQKKPRKKICKKRCSEKNTLKKRYENRCSEQQQKKNDEKRCSGKNWGIFRTRVPRLHV